MAYRYSYLLGHSHSHMYLPTQPCPVSDCPQFTIDSNSIRGHRSSWGQKKIEETLAAMRSAKGSSPSCQAVQRSSDPTASWVLLIIVAFHPTSTSTVEAFNRSAVDSIVFALLFCLLSRTWQCAYSLPPSPRHSISLKSSPYSIISSTFSVLSCHRAAPLIVDCDSKLPLRG